MGQVTSDDSGRPTVPELMDTWTKQKGFPVVGVSISGSSAVLTQQRFLSVPPDEESGADTDDG